MASRNEIELIFKVLNLGKKEMAALEKQLGLIEKKGKKTNKSMGMLGKAIAAIGFAAAAKQAATFVFEATKLAARVETLGVVTETLGRNAGYTATEIRQLERAIQKKGITTQASRQALAKMMQAELDLADATDLARLAQDAAVIAGTNSSEAFQRLINVISTGNVRMARTMGLQVDFNAGYKLMAEQLGKTTDELTATEKAQSRANSVLKEGAQIAGAYESAMDSVGKQLESTPRYWEELRVEIGKTNVTLLGFVNLALQDSLEGWTNQLILMRLSEEAYESGIITQVIWSEAQIQARNSSLDLNDAIEELTAEMDEYQLTVEAATRIDESRYAVILGTVSLTHDLAKSWDGLAEKELRQMQLEAILAGDYALATHIGETIAHLEAEVTALDTLIARLDELDGKTITHRIITEHLVDKRPGRGGGGGRGDWTPPGKPDPIYVPPQKRRGPTPAKPQAAGGPLSSVSLVGEEGFELIINDVVIPHDQSKRLMRLGLVPTEGLFTGGKRGGDYAPPTSSQQDIMLTAANVMQAYTPSAITSMREYLQGGGGGAAPTSSAGNAQVVEATQASVAIASVVAKGNAVNASQNDTIIDILSSLATAEDIELAMTTALELAQL